MKILVTGGAGFIGSHLVDALMRADHTVVVVDNLATGLREYVHPQARFCHLDICAEPLRDVFARERPTVVYHLAAQADVNYSVAHPVQDAAANILGSINILENCVRHGVKRLIFASTGGAVYGNPRELPVTEDHPPHPISPYGVSKLAVEHYVELYHALHGLEYVILRYANVYGPRQSPNHEAGVCAILAGLMVQGAVPTLYGHGESVRDYVYVADLVRANLLALEKGGSATINLGSGRGTSVMEIFDAYKNLTGFAQPPDLAPLRKGEVECIYLSNARAQALLGWQPEIPLREGLNETLEFIRSRRPR